MGCNKDSGCLKIANNTYPGLKSEIDGSMTSIKGQLESIVDELNGLTIPDDYLGSKVKAQISSICGNFSSDMDSITAEKNSIDIFIGKKIIEHQKHYNAWKFQQQQMQQQMNNEIDNTNLENINNPNLNKIVMMEK